MSNNQIMFRLILLRNMKLRKQMVKQLGKFYITGIN